METKKTIIIFLLTIGVGCFIIKFLYDLNVQETINEIVIINEEPVIRKQEPTIRKQEPTIRKHEPAIRKQEPAIRDLVPEPVKNETPKPHVLDEEYWEFKRKFLTNREFAKKRCLMTASELQYFFDLNSYSYGAPPDYITTNYVYDYFLVAGIEHKYVFIRKGGKWYLSHKL